ncbi:Os10g0339101 [Oryza sativa Japonica Group]|uniref:Os10g0339101 protein n=1 Tax=Oryza sativa subsp. japonica TaxID=39947 RepID=A3C3Q1_ORYSJ|nr:hypothetical protein OsJ_31129 [Oryza sativa Japonica Group]BAH94817.1 Os10g0339101 [Oryza sativa Japonica Group]|eukprot:NP_001176089.1 Os10g0339101 [Oryza sativa Japonica Group]
MDGGVGRWRKFLTPWKKTAQDGGGSLADVTVPFPQQPHPQVAEADTQQASDGSRSHSRVQDRLHRLAAMAARAGVASSSATLSPRLLALE